MGTLHRTSGALARWQFALLLGSSAAGGIAAGLGGFTFVYARGASYLTDDPAACANCHVMQDHYDGWRKSSHHAAAVCNDCHVPHGFWGKYFTKALNGYHHSKAFTLGGFQEPIQIKERSRAVVEAECRHCHGELAAVIDGPHGEGQPVACLRCHGSVGHPE
jgi:cytochrome c nitrite reductase small subunit